MPPDGWQGETRAAGDRAKGSGDWLQCSIELRPCQIPSRRFIGRFPFFPAHPPVSSLSTITADGATRAAWGGSAPSVVRDGPVRAGGSYGQRNFRGRSVGMAAAPEPRSPLSDVRFEPDLGQLAALVLLLIRAASRGWLAPWTLRHLGPTLWSHGRPPRRAAGRPKERIRFSGSRGAPSAASGGWLAAAEVTPSWPLAVARDS